MTAFLHGNALWQLVQQSDTLTKGILLLLFVMNVLCTTIFLYKLILLRLKQKELSRAHLLLKQVSSIDDLRVVVTDLTATWPGYLLKTTLSVVKAFIEKHPLQPTLSPQELETVQQVMGQTIDDLMHAEQAYLPVLATSASVSPLIGLFGTIWGLIHAFVRISQRQSADISTVAPGIAEALITTLAGLCVAIPALLMYNYILSKTRAIEHRLLLMAERTNILLNAFFGSGG
jgi:biopolymer transport protein ExbB/TolQ